MSKLSSALFTALTASGAVKSGVAVSDTDCVICAAFPYLAEDVSAPIARYARGMDYHVVLQNCLAPVVSLLQNAGFHAESMADNSPLHEVSLAVSCGIGVCGENGLLIVPGIGSWVFLGFIVTDAPLESTPPLMSAECLGCMACLRDCPTGALSVAGFDAARCLSAITQRKGELTAQERQYMKAAGTLWGCDRCQEVCPMNYGVPLTFLGAFRENLIRTLSPETLEPLSNRTLAERFPHRAFTWRGVNVLKRNAAILYEKE